MIHAAPHSPAPRPRPTAPPCIYKERRQARERYFRHQCAEFIESLYPGAFREHEFQHTHPEECWAQVLTRLQLFIRASHKKMIERFHRIWKSVGKTPQEKQSLFFVKLVDVHSERTAVQDNPFVADQLGLMRRLRQIKLRDLQEQNVLALLFQALCAELKNPLYIRNCFRHLLPRSRTYLLVLQGLRIHLQRKRKRNGSLPHPQKSKIQKEEENKCPICLEAIEDGPRTVGVFPCAGKHRFHLKCLLQHMVVHANFTCPCCRHSIL